MLNGRYAIDDGCILFVQGNIISVYVSRKVEDKVSHYKTIPPHTLIYTPGRFTVL